MTLSAVTDRLLDTLAAYPGTEDAASLTLPPEAYTDPGLYEIEKETIFKHEWLLIGRANDIPDPGDWFTFQVLDEPLLIVRGTDGEIRALSNICRHRYMPIALDEKGSAKRFVCAYHGWVYGTDGRLVAAPLMEGSLAFEKESCKLPEHRLEVWQGFIFVNLDDNTPPLAPQLHEADAMLENYRTDELITGFAYDTIWEGNWKLATENGMEFYHHMGLHAATLEADLPARQARMDEAPASGRFTHSRCFYSEVARNQSEGFGNAARPGCSFAEHERNSAYAIGLFPNISLAMSTATNNWLSFIPIGPERTRVIGGFVVAPEMAADTKVMEGSNELVYAVNEEDGQATWRLQQVMRSAKAAPGPLNVREGTCAQFYKYLGRTLAADRAPGLQAAE
ncbi:MAG: aromatic ring-hydroxylating dioxygenase subunit alpha [Rhodospirillaceae bacterium]|nr:aromatic ring-hydroxylating dioxygenase subunit alpha [Rhodospirillaceae bacterium]MBT7615220.1 aromatic ring-hydroxylating dioxygenase subunit alpha [Rhodospirillaceae bacterium]